MSFQIIPVQLSQNSYPIYVGENILRDRNLLSSHIHGHQVLIVTQENIANYYLPTLQHTLADFQCHTHFLPEGEQAKSLNEWQKILETLLQQGHERNTTLIALGGGAVGDVTGFAAACYQRGVNYLQIPTTLLAQADSAVGGKTAINHPLGKNMIGAFYQPQCVISDVSLLSTLPKREIASGMAEVIKHSLIGDADFFVWLEKNISSLLTGDVTLLLKSVAHSAQMKATIISQDEREQGIRSLLNLGHTFGHAFETAGAFQGLLHGEAVALGMVMAAELSCRLGWISDKDKKRIKQLLCQCELLRTTLQYPSASEILKLMKRDKKVKAGKLNLILLKKIGEAVKESNMPEEMIVSVIDTVLQTL
jgi:3-dehydroquinate synthase